MNEHIFIISAGILFSLLLCATTVKGLGAIQQGGYRNRSFLHWFRRGDNLFFNRLCVLALCLFLVSGVTALCFSFLGVKWAILVSALPFLFLSIVFLFVERRYALKVPIVWTGRLKRLFMTYALFVSIVAVGILEGLFALLHGKDIAVLSFVGYTPFAIMPVLLPFLLCGANGLTRIFEDRRNAKFIARAKEKLDGTDVIRVGIVGSFGKTSVKNILSVLLAEHFSVAPTPASYNTPIGVAKTVFSPDFEGKQVLLVEMGARKSGDIAELCAMTKPDYAVFTGVCEQHISSFKNLENVFLEKSEIIKSGAVVVCGNSLKERVQTAFPDAENVIFPTGDGAKDIRLFATHTDFSLRLGEETLQVESKLLGMAGVENITLACTLAYAMGVTVEELARGVKKLEAIPHRLQLLERGGVYILDDGYNCNVRGAAEALGALARFEGRKCIVTPGIVECGVLEEKINGRLGKDIAQEYLDLVLLVGDTLVGAVKDGYVKAGGDTTRLHVMRSLEEAQAFLADWLLPGDAVLFLNDLPDVY